MKVQRFVCTLQSGCQSLLPLDLLIYVQGLLYELSDDDQEIQMKDIETLRETVSYRDVPKALSSSPLT